MGHFERFPLKIVHWTKAGIKKPVQNKYEPFIAIYLGEGIVERYKVGPYDRYQYGINFPPKSRPKING